MEWPARSELGFKGLFREGSGQVMSRYLSSQKPLISSKRYYFLCSDRPEGASVDGRAVSSILTSGFK